MVVPVAVAGEVLQCDTLEDLEALVEVRRKCLPVLYDPTMLR